MALSPLDIAQRQFARIFRGYDPQAVDAFLEEVSQTMTRLVQDKNEIQAKSQMQDELVKTLRAREDDVKEALVTAQKAIEQQRATADKEAKLKVDAAELQAKQLLADAEGRVGLLHRQTQELARQRIALVEDLRGVLATHVRTLELYNPSDKPRLEAPGHAHKGTIDMLEAPVPPTFLEASTPRPARQSRRSEARLVRQKE